jgi:hypothetical protein
MRRARNAATCHSLGVSPRGTTSSHHTESATIAEGTLTRSFTPGASGAMETTNDSRRDAKAFGASGFHDRAEQLRTQYRGDFSDWS